MANLNLVTGFRGEPHVTAADQGSFNASVFGEGSFVMKRGKEFEASIITNNCVRVFDGDLMIQGRHVRLNENLYIDLEIENGEQALYRNDLIVARYSKEISTGVEQANLIVLKGASSESEAVDPDYAEGNIFNGDVIADFPLYRVRLNGLNIEGIDKLYQPYSMLPTATADTLGGVKVGSGLSIDKNGVLSGLQIVDILPSAVYSKGATVTFVDNPANYSYFFGRVAFYGTNITSLSGSGGQRIIVLVSNTMTNSSIVTNLVELKEKAVGNNNWVVNDIQKLVDGATSSASSIQINVCGIKKKG